MTRYSISSHSAAVLTVVLGADVASLLLNSKSATRLFSALLSPLGNKVSDNWAVIVKLKKNKQIKGDRVKNFFIG
jgi:hypothetical protein